MAQGPEDRVRDALRLEERRVARAWDKLRADTEEKNHAAGARWGYIGGTIIWQVVRNLMDQLQRQIEEAANIRRELCRDVPELGREEQIEAWRRQMYETVAAWERNGIPTSAGRVVGIPREGEVREALRTPEWAERLASIRAIVEREAEMMKEEHRLGVSGGQAAGGGGDIFVRVENSTVGAINLGKIEGDLNASVVSLRQKGVGNVAAEIERLYAAVKGADALGPRQGEVLQGLAAIAQEAERSPNQRRPAVVKALLDYIAPILTSVAGLMEIWHGAYPVIAAFFHIAH